MMHLFIISSTYSLSVFPAFCSWKIKEKIPKIPAMAHIASHTGIQGFFIFKPISPHKPGKYKTSSKHLKFLDFPRLFPC